MQCTGSTFQLKSQCADVSSKLSKQCESDTVQTHISSQQRIGFHMFSCCGVNPMGWRLAQATEEEVAGLAVKLTVFHTMNFLMQSLGILGSADCRYYSDIMQICRCS